jgi:hypothetical protein
MGKAELLAVLPADSTLIDQAWLYLKTQKYVQQNTGSGDETRKAILDPAQSAKQHAAQPKMQEIAAEACLSKAPALSEWFAPRNGGGSAMRATGFAKACQELISFSFPNLRMLKGSLQRSHIAAGPARSG